jgi:NADH dehydrogenase
MAMTDTHTVKETIGAPTPDSNSPGEPRRVVIIGGGFGGVYTALHLEHLWAGRRDVEIVLVSRNNFFLMTPLLFEAGSGVLEPRHAVSPMRHLLRKTRFVQAEVQRVDFDRRIVEAQPFPESAELFELPYDHLVIALGGITNKSIIPGAEHAPEFKTLADAIFLRNHIIELFEQADVEKDPTRKQALLTVVVAGAGLVGVELVGELSEFLKKLAESYPRIDPREIRIELIEASGRVMPEMEQPLADYAVEVFKRRGVNVRVNSPVQKMEPRRLYLPGDVAIDSYTIVIATGVKPAPLIEGFGLAKDKKGRIQTDAMMRSTSHPGVWALGDCASIPDPQGKPYPQLAQHALREAKLVAHNIHATLFGGELKPFVYRTLGMLAALGHYKGVGNVMKLRIYGFFAWWVWRSYYLMQMPQWSRRIRIMLDWTIALFFKNDIVELQLFGEEHPAEKHP